ncbi:ComEA family DNA-binding protein [Dyadobacter tibetensis]|uniref:ComEA family DNA-binding protein n=1 Tax=Dyadobacter tibetensis TaxID=1211851 RepID=UPI00046FB37C|nr:helix-hairpin-helix domain-containing protein [Dyadobacter tibetensis]
MFRGIINELKDFFGLTPKQARATVYTIFVMILLAITPILFNRFLLPLLPIDDPTLEPERLDSLASRIEDELNKADKADQKVDGTFPQSPHRRPIRRFTFNPNLASITDFEDLGIPGFLAKRIDNYRQKGGKFRRKTDLLQIYDFPSALFEELEPYIILTPEVKNERADNNKEKSSNADPPKSSINSFSSSKSIGHFDINSADSSQLLPLKGIGNKLAQRILKFRDALGGFYSKKQYSEIYGLDSLTLQELSRHTDITSPTQKISINTATVERLTSHPYLRNKKLASVIVNYRNQHGPYHSAEDLMKIKVLDTTSLEKILPYISFE